MPAPGRLPFDFPHGYHHLTLRNGTTRLLVVSPRTCHPPAQRGWGWAVQLYALRSTSSWGMGDLGDLRALAAWARRGGASVLMVNPLHAAKPLVPQEPSPYYISSRLFRNPLYLHIDSVPGARGDPVVERLAREAHRLNGSSRIDRDRIFTLKMAALTHLWDSFANGRRLDELQAFMEGEGHILQQYAAFCVLSEGQRKPWRSWPARYRSPQSAALQRFARDHRHRIDFHCWLQWLMQRQLSMAARQASLINDMAVGFAPDGFDAWLWQDVVAEDAHVGAPPDEFSTSGQDWGLVPFDPIRLRRAGYGPLVETLRRVMRCSAGIRVDHVMGMFRLWWVEPARRGRSRRGYVRYGAADMLDILALESRRAHCYVVGEDLGTVESGVRAEMHRRGALSYRLAWFESRPPSRYPRLSLASMSTHDLPTVAGVWTGSDVREQEENARQVNHAAEARTRQRLGRLSGAAPDAPLDEVVEGAYTAIAQAPSVLVAASLDDATLALRRPNMPGAPHRDNWCIPLPRTLEQLRRDALPRRLAALLSQRCG